MSEFDVLIEQLDDLVAEGVRDVSDALELATVAGLVARLGAGPQVMARAEAWRDGEGIDLLEILWDEIDLEALTSEVDGCLTGEATDVEIEDAISDFDDVVAAAVWCGKRTVMLSASRYVAQTIRDAPETFAGIADAGSQMARLDAVGQDLGLYDYWLALADAGRTYH
jgi:hypothetical protein